MLLLTAIQESYSPDDNRKTLASHPRVVSDALRPHSANIGFDLRPFLYPTRFPYQFAMIDHAVAELPDHTGPTMDSKPKTD